MDQYSTVCGCGTGEITEKKSRFIADVFPVASEEEAASHIEKIRKQYWDARHHCWAYVIGRNPGTERMSDDGEPAGTAGKPILEVIKGRRLTDVLVVVTRYFGGTLLGTGGLVRAYTSAAAEGLSRAGIMRKIKGVRLRSEQIIRALGRYSTSLPGEASACWIRCIPTGRRSLPPSLTGNWKASEKRSQRRPAEGSR